MCKNKSSVATATARLKGYILTFSLTSQAVQGLYWQGGKCMCVSVCVFEEEDEEINPMWSQNRKHDPIKHPVTNNDNNNPDRELWIFSCEANRGSRLHTDVAPTSTDRAEPLAALISLCWCWHRAVVAKMASQENPIFELFSLSTVVWIGKEWVWLPDRRKNRLACQSYTYTLCTALGNMSLKLAQTSFVVNKKINEKACFPSTSFTSLQHFANWVSIPQKVLAWLKGWWKLHDSECIKLLTQLWSKKKMLWFKLLKYFEKKLELIAFHRQGPTVLFRDFYLDLHEILLTSTYQSPYLVFSTQIHELFPEKLMTM